MAKLTIAVTGATGKTGSVVVAELRKGGYPVHAWVHREDERSSQLAALGAKVVVVDLMDVERLFEELKGVQRAYYCAPYTPHMLHAAVGFATAAKESGLEHITVLTQWLASPSHPSLMTTQHWLADRVFSMTPNIGLTFVRPGFFADAYMVTMRLAANMGLYPWLYGDHLDAPPSNEDIARVAAATLMNPARHAGATYRPTGPRLVGKREIVESIGRAVGRSVKALPTPMWLFMKNAKLAGFPIELLYNFRDYIHDHKLGAFEWGAPSTDVLDVTGQPAEEFETIARRYAARLENRRTISNWLGTMAQFMAAPLSPGYGFERYERNLQRPFSMNPQYSVESSTWRIERGIEPPTMRKVRAK